MTPGYWFHHVCHNKDTLSNQKLNEAKANIKMMEVKSVTIWTSHKRNRMHVIVGVLCLSLIFASEEVNGQRRSRQRSSISIPSLSTSNTTLRNSLCTSPFSKQRVVGQCKPLVS